MSSSIPDTFPGASVAPARRPDLRDGAFHAALRLGHRERPGPRPARHGDRTNAKTIERQDGTTVDPALALDRKRRIDTAFEVYLGLYQAITGPEERQKIYREFSPGFFDLIVIDECHRGSAAADSAWREILDHFSNATQIGLTATPKETEYVSNTDYFGDPVFTYSLRQGISDGFLAPYKVIKVHIDRDVEGYRPELGQLDRDGRAIEPKGVAAPYTIIMGIRGAAEEYPADRHLLQSSNTFCRRG
jgi:Type III restriction enzyme, res subunit